MPPTSIRFVLIAALSMIASPALAAPSVRAVTIDAIDGVALTATVIEPDSPGPHPAVVLPAPWGQPHIEYLPQGLMLAHRGYVVLAYDPRGFFRSGGAIDVAGPDDVADLSAAIDWLLASTDTDPARIGAAGISYSAGIALLGAAFDDRIRAVVSLSGWSDLVYALYSNQTRRRQSLQFLLLLSTLTGRNSADMDRVLGDFQANRNLPDLIEYARIRGAGTYLDEINRNRPAILMTSAWSETIFPLNPLVDFFESLDGPRRWELRPGDHATPELLGLTGLPNDAWTSLGRWFDHHLRGIDNGIDREPEVVIDPRTGGGLESYRSWSSLAAGTARLHLSAPGGRDGALGPVATAGWSRSIAGGADTVAGAGLCLVSGAIETAVGVPPMIFLPLVSRHHGAVWIGPVLDRTHAVRGAARLAITVTPDRSGPTTVVAYLYDVDRWGVGRLISHLPYTVPDGVAGAAVAIDSDFFITAHDIPAGHRVALVIDTADPLYLDATAAGTTVSVGSSTGRPAFVELPLR